MLGLTLSAANRDLHEVLHENLEEVSLWLCVCGEICIGWVGGTVGRCLDRAIVVTRGM